MKLYKNKIKTHSHERNIVKPKRNIILFLISQSNVIIILFCLFDTYFLDKLQLKCLKICHLLFYIAEKIKRPALADLSLDLNFFAEWKKKKNKEIKKKFVKLKLQII